MPFRCRDLQLFGRDTIQLLHPGQIGVYGIFGAGGLGFGFPFGLLGGADCIYIGKGDIRDRLLRHVNGDIPEILRWGPTYWLAEVTPGDPSRREKELILEMLPRCNQRLG